MRLPSERPGLGIERDSDRLAQDREDRDAGISVGAIPAQSEIGMLPGNDRVSAPGSRRVGRVVFAPQRVRTATAITDISRDNRGSGHLPESGRAERRGATDRDILWHLYREAVTVSNRDINPER